MFSSKVSEIFNLLKTILKEQDYKKVVFIFILMLLGAGLEVFGFTLIIPFIQLVLSPEMVAHSSKMQVVMHFFAFSDPRSFLIFIGYFLIGFFVFKNAYMAFYNFYLNHFLAKKRIELARELMLSYMEMPFVFHLERQTSDLLRNINAVSKLGDCVLLPLMQMITESVIVSVILLFLVFVEPWVTLSAFVLTVSTTAIFYFVLRKRLTKWSTEQHENVAGLSKWLLQGFGGVKETKVLGNEKYFVDKYEYYFSKHSMNQRNINTVTQLPRLFLETILFCGIIVFILISFSSNESSTALFTKLSLFALASIRLLPSMNKIIAATMMLKEGKTTYDLVLKSFGEIDRYIQLEKQAEAHGPVISFQREIEFQEVSHIYPSSKNPAIDQISFQIQKGQSVAFVGQSGAGKSTLVDLLIGLMKPCAGKILVDGVDIQQNPRSWQKKISYIPQQIFLADDTLRRNIAFGEDDQKIDDEKVWRAIHSSRLDEFVQKLPEGLNSRVGENGVRFSGGQRQRIGIARALYRDAELLIMDEATSALDKETERELASNIDFLRGKKSLIIITHRLSSVSNCDLILFLKDGKILAQGSYKSLLEKNIEFAKLTSY